jgi:CO dehydrogenase/acetyl-CoA synthase beta subunit
MYVHSCNEVNFQKDPKDSKYDPNGPIFPFGVATLRMDTQNFEISTVEDSTAMTHCVYMGLDTCATLHMHKCYPEPSCTCVWTAETPYMPFMIQKSGYLDKIGIKSE